MKKVFLLSVALMFGLTSWSQTFKVVNKTKTAVSFQVTASDKNNSGKKYSSATTSVAALSEVAYQSPAQVEWLGGHTLTTFNYTSFSGIYADATGGCVTKASIGSAASNLDQTAVIDLSKCGGSGSLHFTWTTENGNVVVTIK